MSLPYELRITNLIVERLSDALIDGAQVFVLEDADNKNTLLKKVSLSGSYPGTYPRKFEISITSALVAHIKETTLWANLYKSHPAAYEQDVSFVAGTPFEIDSTGIFISIDNTAVVGDEWLVRMSTASDTVTNVVPHPFDYNSLDLPSVSVYPVQDDESNTIVSRTEHDASFTIVLCVSPEQFNSGIGHELKADIRDAINKDRALYDNTDCLSDDCYVINSRLYDAGLESGKAIFMIEFLVKYRTTHNNSRSR